MPRVHVIEVDRSKPLVEEQTNGHNRWHEAIEAAAEVHPGDTCGVSKR
jgi:acetamidase/formamidase